MLIFVLIALFALADRFVAPRHLIWKPLNANAPIGLATGSKITLIAFAPSTVCLNTLSRTQGLEFTTAAPRHDGKTCGWDVGVMPVKLGDVTLRNTNVPMQCRVLLAGYIWAKAVDKAAQKRLGSRLKRIHHAGTYSCRRQKGNGSGQWSEHAFANAWDITGFELEDGRVISVLNDWTPDKGKLIKGKEAKAKAKFLRDARAKACKVFRVVLTPNFNAAHKDHFHLDQGPSTSCS